MCSNLPSSFETWWLQKSIFVAGAANGGEHENIGARYQPTPFIDSTVEIESIVCSAP